MTQPTDPMSTDDTCEICGVTFSAIGSSMECTRSPCGVGLRQARRMSTSETPRTDAENLGIVSFAYEYRGLRHTEICSTDFARQLERELAHKTAEVEQLKGELMGARSSLSQVNQMLGWKEKENTQLTQDLDAARREIERLKDAHVQRGLLLEDVLARNAPGRNSITLNAKQMREVLTFVNPSGSDVNDETVAFELETPVTIEYMPERTSNEGENMPAGLYAYLTEYPEEGVHGPLEE